MLKERYKIGGSSLPRSESKMTSEKKKGIVGLENCGLTCYANATLQCIRHIDKIPWLFTDQRYNTLFKKDATGKRLKQQIVATSFSDVIQQQENGKEGGVLSPRGFWKTLRECVKDTVYDQFCMTAPHDAHEFLMFMLESLHESTSMPVEMEIMKSPPKNESEKRVIQALETWKGAFEKEYSPLVDLFYGLLHIRMECLTCHNVTHRWETFNTIKGSVPTHTGGSPVDLLQMLDIEMKGEDIEGYHCDKCAPTRTTAHRASSIWRLPKVLIICLKRFTFDGRKIHTKVTAPVSEPLNLVTLYSEESPEKEGVTEYILRGIVDHHGGSGGGHYTSQCKDIRDNQWRIYDDSRTMVIPTPILGESTYILFYERRV